VIAGEMMGVVVDDSNPRYPRVKLICSGCASFGIGFPGLPTTEVTVNKILSSAAEHIARSHPDMRLPEVPGLTEGEVPDDDDEQQRAEAARTVR